MHLGLEEYRAIKCVPKKHKDYEAFRKEALLLKSLCHPAIPIVYDLEEDAEYFYLIEEYLEGNSLYTLIMTQGALKETEAVSYGLQICSLVNYLHHSFEKPILYLDLQPKNLILCDGTVRLIDFDHAADCDEANTSAKRYGTAGCAAPEQYTTDRLLDERTDIYAIGAVLLFMVQKTLSFGGDIISAVQPSSVISEALDRVIRKCMETDMEKRYRCVKEAEEALERLMSVKVTAGRNDKADSSRHVVLAGTRSGAGTTHFAFGLCAYGTRQGHKVLYRERNQSGAVRALAKVMSARPDDKGIYRLKGCFMKPWYGPAVLLAEPEGFEVIIEDFGTDWKQAASELCRKQAVLVGVVCENLWESGRTERMMEVLKQKQNDGGLESTWVCRHMDRKRLKETGCIKLWGKDARVFQMPEYPDPFKQSGEIQGFFETVWKTILKTEAQNFSERNWFGKWKHAGLSALPERAGEPE